MYNHRETNENGPNACLYIHPHKLQIFTPFCVMWKLPLSWPKKGPRTHFARHGLSKNRMPPKLIDHVFSLCRTKSPSRFLPPSAANPPMRQATTTRWIASINLKRSEWIKYACAPQSCSCHWCCLVFSSSKLVKFPLRYFNLYYICYIDIWYLSHKPLVDIP